MLGGKFPVHVVTRISQIALTAGGRWIESQAWRFDAIPADAQALFTCIPTVNKAVLAANADVCRASEAMGQELAICWPDTRLSMALRALPASRPSVYRMAP